MTQQIITVEKEKDTERKSRYQEILDFSFRTLILGLVLAGIGFLDFIGLGLNTNALSSPIHHVLISVGQATALSLLISRSKLTGIYLIGSIFAFYYVLVPFLTAVETVIFVPNLSSTVIGRLYLNGIIQALIISFVGVIIFEKLQPKSSFSIYAKLIETPLSEWVWKILAIGGIYVLIYILSGALIFLPFAGDAINLVYADLEMPEWILQFQYLRGILWAVVTIPLLRSLRGDKREIQLLMGISYILLVATLVLMPGGISIIQVQIAHFIELAIGHCFVFGIVVSKLFRE
ncbi:MAG: hypothetical protein GF411_00670 [Candidatus Lokiarchaeota archaeon]|nr:hypothetical protein [Candidatus Lokiarchaeota archaeon]